MKRFLIISCLVGVAAGLFGWLQVQRSGDTSAIIRDAETKLTKAFEPKPIVIPSSINGKAKSIVQIAPAWSEVEEISRPLTWHNRQIAEAKAMLRYGSYHDKMDSYIWERREALANTSWLVEESGTVFLNRLYSGALYALVCFVVAFISLFLISWLWRFFLARVRELSDAIRGK
jgi:hypothetical protein